MSVEGRFSRVHLASLSRHEWGNIDLRAFFDEYSERVISSFIGVHGKKLHLDSFIERHDLISDLFIEGFPRLERRHANHLDVEPINRFGLLYGALIATANTVLRSNIPQYTPIFAMIFDKNGAKNPDYNASDNDFFDNYLLVERQMADELTHRPTEEIIDELRYNELQLNRMLELKRSQFTPRQFAILRSVIVDGASLAELAAQEDCQQANMWWSIEQLRIKLFDMLQSDDQCHDAYVGVLPKRARDKKLKAAITPFKNFFSEQEFQLLTLILTKPAPPRALAETVQIPESTLDTIVTQLRAKICDALPVLCDADGNFVLATFDRYTEKHHLATEPCCGPCAAAR